MLGLGGASAAAGLTGMKALGGVTKPKEGTLWATAQFKPDHKIPAADLLGPDAKLNELVSQHLDEAAKSMALAVDRQIMERAGLECTDRVVTMYVVGDYESGHAKQMKLFGRIPKLGDVIQFRGKDGRYTVIEVDNPVTRRSTVLLDRPLEEAIAKNTGIDVVATYGEYWKSSSGKYELRNDEIVISAAGLQSTITVGQGELIISEEREFEFQMDRGVLDTVRPTYEWLD